MVELTKAGKKKLLRAVILIRLARKVRKAAMKMKLKKKIKRAIKRRRKR